MAKKKSQQGGKAEDRGKEVKEKDLFLYQHKDNVNGLGLIAIEASSWEEADKKFKKMPILDVARDLWSPYKTLEKVGPGQWRRDND